MIQHQFVPPSGAFTRSVPVRFSHCDPAGIVYFPHYFDMFNGLIEDWYTQELGYDYADLIMGSQYGFPFVHIECDFKVPSRMGDIINLTLLVERIGRSSLHIVIVCHQNGIERLCARIVTAMVIAGALLLLPQMADAQKNNQGRSDAAQGQTWR
jgi:4-hydroxybenzoyl-CoA thioesterase